MTSSLVRVSRRASIATTGSPATSRSGTTGACSTAPDPTTTEGIDRDQIPDYLASSSLGIGPLKLTSVTKGALPIKVLEYMASSLPIIAKKGTLQNDILLDGKNGFFVNDAADLSEKIILLLKNPTLTEKLGSKSLKMVQKFSWKHVINSMLEVYKTV